MEYKIEKNVPPPERYGVKWNRKYPWSDMQPGDSILVECESPAKLNCIRNNGNQTLKRLNRPNLMVMYRRESEKNYRFWVVQKTVDELSPEAEAARNYCG